MSRRRERGRRYGGQSQPWDRVAAAVADGPRHRVVRLTLLDTIGRGRYRTVRIAYSCLALLFLLGLVGFLVGSFGGSGVAWLSGGGTNYKSQVTAAVKLTVQQPGNPDAWSNLIHATLLQARTGEYYTPKGAFTAKAWPLLIQVQEAWHHYLKLNSHDASPNVASEVLQVYETKGGVSNPPAQFKVWKIEAAHSPPSASMYGELATAAYAANDPREGDLAAKKAIALAPPSEHTTFKRYLAEFKESAAVKYGRAVGGKR
jgi:hypothetical protein